MIFKYIIENWYYEDSIDHIEIFEKKKRLLLLLHSMWLFYIYIYNCDENISIAFIIMNMFSRQNLS